MVLGRILNARYRALPNIGTFGRIDLQLVELVLSCGQTGWAHESNCQQALCCWPVWVERSNTRDSARYI
jgi:hypothetical protein